MRRTHDPRARGVGSHGFSLFEIMIVAGLGVLMITLLVDTYMTARRQSAKLEVQLSAVQGAQLLIERIRQDIACSIHAPGDSMKIVESVHGGQQNRFNLLVFSKYRFFEKPSALYDPNENDPSWIETDRVSYTFDPATHRVSRTSPAGVETLSFARFLSVSFVFLQNGIAPGGVACENMVTVVMQCAPDEAFLDEKHRADGALTIPISLPLLSRSIYESTDLWVDSWFHLSPKVLERVDEET